MGVECFSPVGPLEFPNVIEQNGSNYVEEMRHLTAVETLKIMHPLFYSHFFPSLSLWEKAFLGPQYIVTL